MIMFELCLRIPPPPSTSSPPCLHHLFFVSGTGRSFAVFIARYTGLMAEAGYITTVLGHNVNAFRINMPVLIRPHGCVFQRVLRETFVT